MFIRIALLVVLAPAVAGCATNYTGIGRDQSLDTLRTQNVGLVLIHTALNNQRCTRVLAQVAHPDASGSYVYTAGDEIALKRILDRSNVPVEVQLPAGEYGIVGLQCESGNERRNFSMRATKQGSILTGDGAVYAQPMAKFSVHAGEFVDVGSLQLPIQTTGTFFRPGEFKAYVVPNDETVVQTLAAKRPEVYAHLVRRLMTVPGQQQEPSQIVAPQAAH